MNKDRPHARKESTGDRQAWRVVDDFPDGMVVSAAELDAVEAFLMPLVNAILLGERIRHHDDDHDRHDDLNMLRPVDSQVPQKAG